MKLDVILPDTRDNIPDVAAELEKAGWAGLWASEVNHDPFLPLALAATRTERVQLGTGIAVAFARTPMTTAQVAWDLQRLSRGRLVLGLGSQIKAHIERRFSMPWSKPAARMREYVLAMRAVWESWQHDTPLDFHGEFYRHTLMTPTFDPGPIAYEPPQVLLAAVGTRMASVAGEVADGMLAHSFSTPRYLREVTLPAARQGLRKAGREEADFAVKYTPFVVTGVGERAMADSARKARERIAFYASTPAYRPVLELHGWGELQPILQDMSRRGEWVRMGEFIDDDVLDAFAVTASPEELPAALRRRTEGLSDRVGVSLADLGPETATRVQAAFR